MRGLKILVIALSATLLFNNILWLDPTFRKSNQARGDGGGDPTAPMLVLHIGPHKTATSTEQCALTRYKERIYAEASVAYLGMNYEGCRQPYDETRPMLDFDTRTLFRACFEKDSPPPSVCRESKAWKTLEGRLEYFSNRGESVVISDEAFARSVLHADSNGGGDNKSMLYELFNKYFPGRVRVVLVYRRYFEWLVSMWNEANKKKVGEMWPSEGGMNVEIFPEYIKHLTGYSEISAQRGLHPVKYLQSMWTNHSSEVLLLDLHEMRDDREGTVIRFVREILPPPVGDVLAREMAADHDKHDRPNLSRNVDFDRLAVAAHQEGLFKNMSRGKIRKMAEKYLLAKLNTTLDRLPRVCPEETQLQEILNNSLKYKRQVFPEKWSEKASRKLKLAFEEAEAQGMFCNMDTDKLMEDDAVRKFFQLLV